jgi:hypothetical protein
MKTLLNSSDLPKHDYKGSPLKITFIKRKQDRIIELLETDDPEWHQLACTMLMDRINKKLDTNDYWKYFEYKREEGNADYYPVLTRYTNPIILETRNALKAANR